MKPATEYLVAGIPAAEADAWGDHVVALRFAGETFVFRGLSVSQQAVVVERFGRLVVPVPMGTAGETLPGAHFRPAAWGAFVPLPDTPWEYDLALDFHAGRVDVAGLQFFARLQRGPYWAEVLTCVEDSLFLNVFENLFRIIAVYVLAQRDTLVIHSAGVAQNSQGYLLFGRSGAGKTTSCRLLATRSAAPGSPAHDILSDELNAVDLRAVAPGVLLQPMPFAGDFGHDTLSTEAVPLRRIYALVQAPVTRVTPCAAAEALARVVAACPYVNVDPFESDSVFARAERLLSAVPLRKLYFPKDPSFWSAVEADGDLHAVA